MTLLAIVISPFYAIFRNKAHCAKHVFGESTMYCLFLLILPTLSTSKCLKMGKRNKKKKDKKKICSQVTQRRSIFCFLLNKPQWSSIFQFVKLLHSLGDSLTAPCCSHPIQIEISQSWAVESYHLRHIYHFHRALGVQCSSVEGEEPGGGICERMDWGEFTQINTIFSFASYKAMWQKQKKSWWRQEDEQRTKQYKK